MACPLWNQLIFMLRASLALTLADASFQALDHALVLDRDCANVICTFVLTFFLSPTLVAASPMASFPLSHETKLWRSALVHRLGENLDARDEYAVLSSSSEQTLNRLVTDSGWS